MNIGDIIAAITGGMDPNKAIMDAQGAMPGPPGPPPQQAAPPPPTAPQGASTPVTNPVPQGEMPKAYQSPGDLTNMYLKLMSNNQNAQALDSGATLIAAGLSNNLATRAALINSANSGGGKGAGNITSADLINLQKQAQANQDMQTRRAMLGGLMKQYKMTPEQIQYLEASGKLDEVIKHYSTENLAQATDANGQVHFVAPRTGKLVATIGSEKEDPTQLADTPQGKQVVNMRTGAPVGAALGPTDANVDAIGTKFPALDKGFDYQRDEKGLVKLVDGKPKVDVITGTPAERELVDAQQKKVEQKMQAQTTISNVSNAAKAVQDNIGGFMATGVGTKLAMKTVGQLGGLPMNIVQDNIDTIKANASFEKLAQMRQASPTGGALGNVSDFENKLLSGATAALTTNLRADKLMENIYRVQATMELLSDKKYTDEKSLDADVKKRVDELKSQNAPASQGITVRRREQPK